MTIKPKVILLKTLLVLISILFVFCKKKSSSKITLINQKDIGNVYNYIQLKDTILVKRSILNFLTQQQDLFESNKIEDLSNHVSFPLDGDVLYFMIFGNDFLNSPQFFFEQKIDKKTFIKKNKLIFSENYKNLFCNTNFSQMLFDNKYRYIKKDEKGVLWELDTSINFTNNSFKIYLSKIAEESEEEYSIFYSYSLIKNKYLLSYIGAAG